MVDAGPLEGVGVMMSTVTATLGTRTTGDGSDRPGAAWPGHDPGGAPV